MDTKVTWKESLGWAIGDRYDAGIDLAGEANSSFFHTQRMVLQYFAQRLPRR